MRCFLAAPPPAGDGDCRRRSSFFFRHGVAADGLFSLDGPVATAFGAEVVAEAVAGPASATAFRGRPSFFFFLPAS